MNLTEKAVTKLKAGKKREQYVDDDVTGFGVRIEPNGRKSFYWFAKVNGKPRFRALGEFPSTTVAEARDAATVLSGKAKAWKQANYAGDDPFEKEKPIAKATVPTFSELVESYIANHVRSEANKPERAEYNVRWTVKRHFADWGARPVDSITVEDMLAVKRACGDRRYLANRAVEFVRSVFNWSATSRDAKINFWKVENPAKDVETFKEKARERYLEADELARFNDCLKTEKHADLKDVLILAINTGARRSDIFGMRWQDMEWERESWRVPFPKNGQSYDVQLLPAALGVLKRRRAEQPESATYVFPGVGRDGHLVDLKKPWNDFRKRAQIPDIRLHDLRRTVGSYLAMSGVSLQQIGKALGHQSLQSTEIYARFCSEVIRDARQAGQTTMVKMMTAARKRTRRLTAKPARRLSA